MNHVKRTYQVTNVTPPKNIWRTMAYLTIPVLMLCYAMTFIMEKERWNHWVIGFAVVFLLRVYLLCKEHQMKSMISPNHTPRVSERGLVFQDDEKIARVSWSSITSVTLLSPEQASEEKLLWVHINGVVRIKFVDYDKPAQLIEAVKKYLPSEKIRTGKRALFANHHTVLYQNHWGKTKTPRSLLDDDKEDS